MRERLEVLERELRRASDGGLKLGDYAAWLKTAGVAVPSRQTLRTDLERYAQQCDDLVYGDHQKIVTIDRHAGEDAIRYFLGDPWLTSPLKPRLSSSVCRCFLLAMHLTAEVEFQYAALPKPGLAPTFQIHRGIPLRTLPGSDSGYLAIWQEQGFVVHINLARVLGKVAFTGGDTCRYQPQPSDPKVGLVVQSEDRLALERCSGQFEGGITDGGSIRFPMPASLAVMSADQLEAWWRRTQSAERKAERHLDLPEGAITIRIQSDENT